MRDIVKVIKPAGALLDVRIKESGLFPHFFYQLLRLSILQERPHLRRLAGCSLALTTSLSVNDVVLVDLAVPGRRANRNELVIIEQVNKFYGDLHVLKDITTNVARGEVVVVIGPSGSGKSTLCRVINRLETIDSGAIFIDGEPLPQEGKELARLRADVGMVFQSFNLFAHKTALENVTLGPIKVRNMKPQDAREKAMLLLERVGVAKQAKNYPHQLSGGQQQRVAIARSLAMNPKLILLDEPTSALDPEMINEVLDVMVGLASEGMTMVVVTHEMGFARNAGSRVLFMADGQILEEAPPAEFFAHPTTARATDFLSKILAH
jgi:glutamate transport system ATP-binding protein